MRGPSLFPIPILLACLPALAYQHGTFRSQATQGAAWTGSASLVRERVVMTAYPDYLDVEHEWEFGVGGSEPAEHKDALEIVGNFSLEYGSVLVGALVWYKGEILQAKLKSRERARKEYEDVVDRNAPVAPKPRDPVIIEGGVSKGNYDISIFPVAWGATRKIRMRYLIAAFNFNGVHSYKYPHAFTRGAEVLLRRGAGTTGFVMESASKLRNVLEQASLAIDPKEYCLTGECVAPDRLVRIRPLAADAHGSILYLASFGNSRFSGHFAHAYFRRPAVFSEDAEIPSEASLHATLSSKSDSCTKGIGSPRGIFPDQDLRIYSDDPLEERIIWTARLGEEVIRTVEEIPTVIRMESGNDHARIMGMAEFYPMARTMPASLAVALGFVDRQYSLVALEEDALSRAIAEAYMAGGVPAVSGNDIFPATGGDLVLTMTEWLKANKVDRDRLLLPTALRTGLPEGMRFSVRDGVLTLEWSARDPKAGANVQVSICGLTGRIVKEGAPFEIAAGRLAWSPRRAGMPSGAYVILVIMNGKTYTQGIHIP